MDGLNIVRFRDAKDDFKGVAELVDETGAVVILRNGRPAYVLANYDDVTVNEVDDDGQEGGCRCGGHGPGGHGHGHGGHGHGGHRHGGCGCGGKGGAAKASGDSYSANTGGGDCDCGADKGSCDCGRHGPSGTPGDSGPGDDRLGGASRHKPSGTPGDSGPAKGDCGCGGKDDCCGTKEGSQSQQQRAPRPASHRPDWQRPNERHADRRRREWEEDPRAKNYEWAERKIREFERAARKRHEEGGGVFEVPAIPGFLPTEFVGIVPDEVIEAGEQIVNKLANIFGAFTGPQDNA